MLWIRSNVDWQREKWALKPSKFTTGDSCECPGILRLYQTSTSMKQVLGQTKPLPSCRGPVPFQAQQHRNTSLRLHAPSNIAAQFLGHNVTDGAQRVHLSVPNAASVEVAAPVVNTPVQQQVHSNPEVRQEQKTAPTFQEAIARLQEYWAKQGCIVWLPHNTEVGAGTMNPATFLRVQGPEPWNVAYAEPSIRPDDSRYGDNPNRLQRHTQFQVILKPDPGNSQELYLGSLEALGIDTRAHDVRFVEDNWESPVLGAWGLGWEVWLDGMEVTQFTYFQQAGGKTLEAPAVEITYGMERILMNLQGVKNFKDIRYNDQVTYGELFLQNEYEMSVYNLDEADIAEQRARFDLYEVEARRMLAKRLPIPAYDHLLKLSHTFNILDARGAVGVTERANCFATMRALAREVTGLWLSRREELGHPMGTVPALVLPEPKQPALPAAGTAAAADMFVLEVGTEELPPDEVDSALEQLRQKVPALLQRLRLSFTGVKVEGTPRRLTVMVHDLAQSQTSEESQVRGPPKKQAYAADGSPSKALEGFCKKNGVSLDTVTVSADAKGVEYVFATVKDAGQPAAVVLMDELPKLLSSIAFKKSMRWRGDAAFSRPVRWLLALHGATVVPFMWGGLQAAAVTRLLRNSDTPVATVASAGAYHSVLAGGGIQLGTADRKAAIMAEVKAAAAKMGGIVPDNASTADLLAEVSNLVEAPQVVAAGFDASFLQLPKEVLIMVMRKHQRYFPVLSSADPDASLLPAFITVANGPVDPEVVAEGNQAVLRARFEDATFFYNEDLKTSLDQLRPKLNGTLFQKDLGSLLDKATRVEALVQPLAAATGLEAAHPGVTAVAQRAAHLAKADLASSTVMEMTALAGTMGRHYAIKQGLPADVCEAIFEACLPRQAGDLLPKTPAGILAAVADRLDSIVGLFSAGCAPTASADPYGLRRAAYGMLQALVSNKVSLSLKSAVAAAAGLQPQSVSEAQQAAVLDYMTGRLEQLISDTGIQAEVVRAVLAERGDNPSLASSTAEQLQASWTSGSGQVQSVMACLSRPTRIVRGKEVDPSWTVDPALFELQEEKDLHAAVQDVMSKVNPATASVEEFLAAAAPLAAPVEAYFDKVFVMCEDEAVKRNRLAFLRDLAGLTKGWADLSQLPGF